MRHGKKVNHLGRKSGHRKAMLANMANSLILHKRIETTTAKAKALRVYVEPLITKSKEDTTNSRRTVFSYLQNKEAVTELFREISPKIMERPGGYTRILKTGARLGDNADMCIIELVDYNENLLAAKEDKAKAGSRRRRRGGAKKKTAEAPVAETAQAEVIEEVVEEKVENTETVEDTAEVAEETAAAEAVEELETEAKAEEVAAEETPAEEPTEEEKKEEGSDEEEKKAE